MHVKKNLLAVVELINTFSYSLGCGKCVSHFSRNYKCHSSCFCTQVLKRSMCRNLAHVTSNVKNLHKLKIFKCVTVQLCICIKNNNFSVCNCCHYCDGFTFHKWANFDQQNRWSQDFVSSSKYQYYLLLCQHSIH